MSRRRRAEKREVLPDPKFGDIVLSKFMNVLMYSGKKSVAEGIVYGALDRIQQRGGQDPVRVFHEALNNVRPEIEVRSRRVGGATYQVPVEVRQDRAQTLAIAIGRLEGEASVYAGDAERLEARVQAAEARVSAQNAILPADAERAEEILAELDNRLGARDRERPAVPVFRLWRVVQRGDHRHADRRDEDRPGRHPP